MPRRRAAVALLVCAAAAARATPPLESAALALINRSRADVGLAPLRPDARLAAAARAHAAEMRTLGYTGHESPVRAHRTPELRLGLAGVADAPWGENVGHYGTARPGADRDVLLAELHARLLRSPAHRRHLLDPAFTHVGVGLAEGTAPADADPDRLLPALWIAELFVRRALEFTDVRAHLRPDGLAVAFVGTVVSGTGAPRLAVSGPGGHGADAPLRAQGTRFVVDTVLPPGTGTWDAVFLTGPGAGRVAAAFAVDTAARPDRAVHACPPPE